MKKIIIIIFAAALAILVSCKEKSIPTYSGEQYVFFERPTSDTLTFMYLNYPSHEDIEFPITVKLIGNPVEYDRSYSVMPVKSKTTASTANYEIPSKILFKSHSVKDTLWLKIKYSELLKTTEVTLTIEIVDSPQMRVGPLANSRLTININDFISKPDWWDSKLQGYIGDYNEKKYKEFIKATGVADLSGADLTSEVKMYCIQFKHYLQRSKDEGAEIMNPDEAGGGPMLDDLALKSLIG